MSEIVNRFLISHRFKLSRTKPNLWYLRCTLDGEDLLLYVDLRGISLSIYAYFCDGRRTRVQDKTIKSLPLVKELMSLYSIGLPPSNPNTLNTSTSPRRRKKKNQYNTSKKKKFKTLDDYDFDTGG